MGMVEGQRILITGPAGQIAFPLAARLAKDNEVFGIARFSDASTRERCEAAGIATAVVDLSNPDWSKTPESFDYVLHLAAAIVANGEYDLAKKLYQQQFCIVDELPVLASHGLLFELTFVRDLLSEVMRGTGAAGATEVEVS